MKLNDLSPQALKAAMESGTEAWGQWGSAKHHSMYVEKAQGNMRRRKCHCGCGGGITHCGTANGVGLVWGCELKVRRFVRFANSAPAHVEGGG